MAVTIVRTWHYGNDIRVEEFTGESLLATMIRAKADMPDQYVVPAVEILKSGQPYRVWSWYTFELKSV